MVEPYKVEIEPEEADRITLQVLKETRDAILSDPDLWGKGWKKDLKAIKRTIKMYEW